jgi:hypothetical protein
MPFKKGKSGNVKGREAGTPNKLTKTVKETVLAAFNDLQSDPKANIMTWAKDNPTDFYKIASKLIPTEVNANVEIVKAELPPFMKTHESES